MSARRLMAVLAHPDDESLGLGGTLAKYAAEGVETFLLTATRGDGGRYGNHRLGDAGHPGRSVLGGVRERELRAAASVLGIKEVAILDYPDQQLDRADPQTVIAAIVDRIRRVRPDVVVTFGPDGAYGHPDHIAISQFTTAAVVAAADRAIAKLYYIAWPESTWAAYQRALKKLTSVVDGVERQVVPWPDWAITTVIDAHQYCDTVWRAISCHESQMSVYTKLQQLPREHYEALWGVQSFYRVFSRVNGGRTREIDLFEGIRT
jgi:LmbE family N-acetylglucosaminyl deacetylase